MVTGGLGNRTEEPQESFAINLLLNGIRILSNGVQGPANSGIMEASANHVGLKAGINSLFGGITDSNAMYLTYV